MLRTHGSLKPIYYPKISSDVQTHAWVHAKKKKFELENIQQAQKSFVHENSCFMVLWLFSNISNYTLVSFDHWLERQ